MYTPSQHYNNLMSTKSTLSALLVLRTLKTFLLLKVRIHVGGGQQDRDILGQYLLMWLTTCPNMVTDTSVVVKEQNYSETLSQSVMVFQTPTYSQKSAVIPMCTHWEKNPTLKAWVTLVITQSWKTWFALLSKLYNFSSVIFELEAIIPANNEISNVRNY